MKIPITENDEPFFYFRLFLSVDFLDETSQEEIIMQVT